MDETEVFLYPTLLKGVPLEMNAARLRGHEAFYGPAGGATMQNAITLGDYYLEQYLLNTRSGKRAVIDDQQEKLLEWLRSLKRKRVDVDTINRMAPKETGARGSVDRARVMMQRLFDSGSVRVAAFNNRELPAEWELL